MRPCYAGYRLCCEGNVGCAHSAWSIGAPQAGMNQPTNWEGPTSFSLVVYSMTIWTCLSCLADELTSASCPCAASLPGYRVHLLGSSAFLPHLPAPLQYSNVQGGIVVVLDSNASVAAASLVPFQATVLGISPAYAVLATSPALTPAPADFTPPVLPGLNVTYYGNA